MENDQPKRVADSGDAEVSTEPLSLDKILLSLSAQYNILGKWIASQSPDLAQYGAFSAASDCLCAADVLLEVVHQWEDQLKNMDVIMPEGVGYVPFPNPTKSGQ